MAYITAWIPGAEAMCSEVSRTEDLTPEEFVSLFHVEQLTEVDGETEEDQSILSVKLHGLA